MFIRFLKNWTLPVAMLSGALAYFFFAKVAWVAPCKPLLLQVIALLTPTLIFAQLLLTGVKLFEFRSNAKLFANKRLAIAVSKSVGTDAQLESEFAYWKKKHEKLIKNYCCPVKVPT